ncbi:MAG TPA: bifunctional proline dehydrogenase/L-glutamate gamma-semialdehyde dehydrogenase PutA, partial [Azonexus sp.]|nr:bifunctional proline dehydrogenase/L-glutamate gamma-semialdehyde dehydrogenase PutA [Azonexus sp.]
VIQAYQKRCPYVVDWLVDLARRSGRRLMVRLVKGAYWDSEIKRAQVDGLADYPVYTRKPHSDLSYLVCAHRLLAAPDAIYPQFATHNAHTLASVCEMARAAGVEDYEFQCLHGMGEPLYDNVVGAGQLGKPCRIYAPVGTHETLLPYLVRRLLENGANSSFVNRLVDAAVSVDELVENPLDRVRREGGARHPKIGLPPDLFGAARRNSAGVDLADENTIAELEKELAALALKRWQGTPLVAGAEGGSTSALAVRNPADRADVVGTVIEADSETLGLALSNAADCAARWNRTPPAERAAALQRAADLLEAHRPQLLSLCLREAGKTWGNAVAELREAVDFCRYYAAQLTGGHLPPAAEAPGPVVCISPWNFPLAIFIGEVSAALAAGSPVLAKPAEQTPLIAGFAVELLHQAGIPLDVLQFLPGRGETVGAALTADTRVRGVVFTGSTEVARLINQTVAERPGVRLIAETGGQNAMIVDSSALPEQVVQDVLVSGFDSAGQRCSALRVLCLQEEIAERVLAMLRDAMRELVIGNPARLATDIGPVIDDEARRKLVDHIERMRASGKTVFQLPLPAGCERGSFVPPTLIEIDALAELRGEVFGPVVHVLRFAGDRLAALIEAINASAYGLTLGIHSRIDETVAQVTEHARVGNIYVNRNMVGAVVGVQPFGGEGLSGTGPKAGGPLYLPRLAGAAQVGPGELAGLLAVGSPAADSALPRLAAWCASVGQHRLAARCAEYAALSLWQTRLDLPGPTGERNALRFVPRGVLLCLADEENAWLGQLAAVLATGNTPAAVDSDFARNLLARLPAELAGQIRRQLPEDYQGVAGVLFVGTAEAEICLRQRLAMEPGPLIPLYRMDDRQAYPLYRMLSERVVSVNTTAAGGNTSLMTLGA